MEALKGMLFAIGLLQIAMLLALLGTLVFFPLLVISLIPGLFGVVILCTWYFVKTPPEQPGRPSGEDGEAP